MTTRDRTVLMALAVLAVLAGSWMLVLAPVRKDASALDTEIAAAQTALQSAKAGADSGESARLAYRDDYAAVAQLGKAVPADDDVPSLVYQLETAADRSRVDFRSMELAVNGAAATPPPAPVPAAPATGATGTTGATGATGVVPAAAPTQAAVATLPPGAAVGSAGFPTMPFDFAFTGSFFRLQDFLERLDRFTELEGDKITVRGRLLTVDGFAMEASSKGFPNMRASVRATSYLLPSGEGLTGAAPADPNAPAGTATLTAPTADATGASTE